MIIPMGVLMVSDGRYSDGRYYDSYCKLFCWSLFRWFLPGVVLMGFVGCYSDGCSNVYSNGFYWLLVRSLISRVLIPSYCQLLS